MTNRFKFAASFLAAIFAIASCDPKLTPQDPDDPQNQQPEPETGMLVTTMQSVDPSYTSITLPFKIDFTKAPEGFTVFSAGVYVSDTNETPGAADIVVSLQPDYEGSMDMSGDYELWLADLQPGTNYYYRAFALFDRDEFLGDVKQVATKPVNISKDKEIDLGLGIKWAGWNVGATKPEEYGDFFAWGETKPQEDGQYSARSYVYGSASTVYKYCNDPAKASGKPDGRTKLMAQDDAAYVNWGDGWRTPTVAEKRELLQNTDRVPYVLNGVKGWAFISKINNVAMFFPATGFKLDSDYLYEGEQTTFWTSEIRNSDNVQAHICCDKISGSTMFANAGFDMDATGSDSYNLSQYRYYGFPVRAVRGTIDAEKYTVTTLPAENVKSNSATIRFNVSGNPSITEQGVLYTASVAPCIFGQAEYTTCTDFAANVTGLYSGYEYRAAAYIIADGIVYYGNEVCFTPVGPDYNGYDYVDLGLPSGLKWASRNIGADVPEDFGGFFAWGETFERDVYNMDTDNYSYAVDESQYMVSKYCTNEYDCVGAVDNLTVLLPEDDAAHVVWGGSWRMPTKEDAEELVSNCTWAVATHGDTLGSEVTGPNGNTIFLPFAGNKSDRHNQDNWEGWYWTSSLSLQYNYCGHVMNINSYYHEVNTMDRYYGFTIRPVSD